MSGPLLALTCRWCLGTLKEKRIIFLQALYLVIALTIPEQLHYPGCEAQYALVGTVILGQGELDGLCERRLLQLIGNDFVVFIKQSLDLRETKSRVFRDTLSSIASFNGFWCQLRDP